MLKRIPDKVGDELRQPVSIPLPPQVAHRFIANDRCRMKRLEFKDRVLTNLLQVSWRSLDGNARSEPRTRQSNKSVIRRFIRCALLSMRAPTRARCGSPSAAIVSSAAPAVMALSGVRKSWLRMPMN